MFRQFAGSIPGGAKALFRLHPSELANLLEQAWEFRRNDSVPIGHPNRRSTLPGLPDSLLELFPNFDENRLKFTTGTGEPGEPIKGNVIWDHLVYALMVENTRVFDIFEKVVKAFAQGESLGVPIADSEHWLRNTEELMYKHPASFTIYSLRSNVRDNVSATRRNAYHRLLGMEVVHQNQDQLEYVKPKAANSEFVYTFEEFLREVWVAIRNQTNTSGSNSKDDSEIANLAEKLHDMLRTRRLGSNLSREEFFFVSLMSWFHLSLEFDSPIVLSLRSDGASPEQRLHKIAQRVDLPAHSLSKNFFDMADAISRTLIQIETGVYNDTAAVPALYTTGTSQERDIRNIITHWSITTGHDLKSKKVVSN